MPKVSPERLAQTRRTIVEAASACLAELGVDGTTTRAVAHRAGVANGLLYRYFPTKEELLVAVAAHESAERTPTLLDAPEGTDGYRSLLHSIAASLFDGAPTSSSVLPALRAAAVGDSDIRAALHRYDSDLSRQATSLLTAAMAQGAVATTDPAATVEVIQSLFEGVQARLASGTVTTSPTRLANAAVELVDRLATTE